MTFDGFLGIIDTSDTQEDVYTERISWDELFMSIAELFAKRSADPTRKVGAVIVNDEHKIISAGYNGMCKVIEGLDNDEIYPWTKNNPEPENNKFPYVVHAELNAILTVADLMCAAAKTAPKGSGKDTVRTAIVTGAEKDALRDKMIAMAEGTNGLMNNMRFIPLPLKVFGTRTLYSIFGDNVFTCPFSNLGKVDLPPDMAEEITGMDFLLGTSFFHRAQVTGCAVNGITTLSISKYTKDPSFEERLYNIFKDDGLDVVVEGSEYNGN